MLVLSCLAGLAFICLAICLRSLICRVALRVICAIGRAITAIGTSIATSVGINAAGVSLSGSSIGCVRIVVSAVFNVIS